MYLVALSLDDFNRLPPDEQKHVIDILVTELDNQSDDLQSKAMGYLFNAYISGSIDRLMFMGIAHELRNTNPLVFYFNVDNVDGYNLPHKVQGQHQSVDQFTTYQTHLYQIVQIS